MDNSDSRADINHGRRMFLGTAVSRPLPSAPPSSA
jgi:hypothetical protein